YRELHTHTDRIGEEAWEKTRQIRGGARRWAEFQGMEEKRGSKLRSLAVLGEAMRA
ncbi:hypothetical protein SK128_028474, partial [Halocaridina rubra]